VRADLDPEEDVMTEPGHRSVGRRARLNPTVLIGAVLVLATIGALMLVRPAEPADPSQPPTKTTLTNATIGCPAALGKNASAAVASGIESASGDVAVRSGNDERTVSVPGDAVVDVPGIGDPAVFTAEGKQAPGLLASRFGSKQVAALDCPAPSPDTWFTGLGAGAQHTSVLELVNPDEGPAIADITVLGKAGPVEADDLRGVRVPGHDSVSLDLSEVLPRRNELAVHVTVSRGRLATSVLDVVSQLGAGPDTSDWMAPSTPSPRSLLLGLAPGRGDDVLAVGNPGADEARARVRVVTEDSVFAPEGLDEIRVPPGSVRTVPLTDALRAAVRDGAIGIEVTGTVPVTTSLRSVVDDDVSHAVPVTRSSQAMTALVPDGAASVVLADAKGVGTVTVTSFAADGEEVDEETVEVKPGTGGSVDLPPRAALVRVASKRTEINAAALVTGDGAAAVPFDELTTKTLVPSVRPGLS
jgi:hypothetical protein